MPLMTMEAGAPQKKWEQASIVPVAASFTVLVTLVAAQTMARSRAGLLLSIIALFGALALAFAERRRGEAAGGVGPARLLMGATAVAVIFAAQFALYRIMQRFTTDPLEDARLMFAATTLTAAKAYLPFGSGFGTFVPVYALFEKPEDALLNTYVNRAHNDIAEVWLEGGVAAAAPYGGICRVARDASGGRLAAGRHGRPRHRPDPGAGGDAGARPPHRPFARRLSAAHGSDDGRLRLLVRAPGRAAVGWRSPIWCRRQAPVGARPNSTGSAANETAMAEVERVVSARVARRLSRGPHPPSAGAAGSSGRRRGARPRRTGSPARAATEPELSKPDKD